MFNESYDNAKNAQDNLEMRETYSNDAGSFSSPTLIPVNFRKIINKSGMETTPKIEENKKLVNIFTIILDNFS